MKRNLLLCSAAALLAWGCKDGGTTPSVATTVAVSPGAVSLNAVGATQVVRATVTDQKGKTMSGAGLAWSSSTAGVTVAGAGGDSAIVTAVANGPATVTATAGSAAGTVAVQVTQDPASLQKTAGDSQTGTAGGALGTALQVTVRDRLNAPVPGVTVAFAIVGGGSLSTATATSGANGVATATWTLGPVAGSSQEVIVSANNLPPVQFSATAVAGPAATTTAAAGNEQGATPGTPVALAPRVRVADALGNSVAGVSVQFTVTGGGGSVTGGTQTTNANGVATVGGWTLGPAAGINTLTATFPGTSLPPVVFTANAGNGGTLALQAGDNQAAMVGSAVPTVPTVVVRDLGGTPLAGVTVNFTVAAGNGTVGNASATTNASGVASVGSWVLGTAGPNTLTASVVGLTAAPVSFRGIGCTGAGAGYTMTLCFTTAMTASQRAVFQNAATRWGTVITGELPNTGLNVTAGECGNGSPRLNMTVDDLVIFASITPIDGPGAVLGSAGPCFIRSEGTGSLPVLGLMRFDAADVAQLESSGQFSAVILHEMGHVLGIGTMWSIFELLQSPSSNSSRLDTWYSGANGIAGFDAIGGTTYTGGQKVPVENTGGQGTMNGHWRESVLGRELMTGFLNSGVTNPLSQLTVRSLIDMGYVVNVAAADAFTVTLTAQGAGAASFTGVRMHDDIYTGPLYSVDRQGRKTRIRN